MRPLTFVLAIFVGLLANGSAWCANTGWLGVGVAPLTADTVAKTRGAVTSGAMIASVTQGSPAAVAGLRTGEVVTFADGQPVSVPDDLIRIVSHPAPGDTVLLMVVSTANGFNSRNITVGLSTQPPERQAQASQPSDGIYNGFDDFKAPKKGKGGVKDDFSDLKNDSFDEGLPVDHQAPAKKGRPAHRAAGNLGSAHVVPVGLLQGQYCRALAPAGWSIGEQDAQGRFMTVISADQRLRATYAIVGINSGGGLTYVRPQGGDPVTQAMTLSSLVAGQRVQGISRQQFMGAALINFRGSSEQGYVLFRTYPVPGDPYSYVLSAHIAVGPTQRETGVAGAVASTINCVAQFRPPAGGYAHVEPKTSRQATGTSSRCRAGDCDDGDLAGTYNVQLGTGYVHSETGQNYLVDPATDYHETGPDGPGYYRQVGNSYEKLTPGWE